MKIKQLTFTALILMLMATPALAESAFVQKVMDAKTLKLLNGDRVRLIGLDIPDGEDAFKFVRGLVSGGVVELEYDEEQRDEDGYLLAYVWFEYELGASLQNLEFPKNYEMKYVQLDEGLGKIFVFLNATILKSGFGAPNSIEPNTRHAEYLEKIYQDRTVETAMLEVEPTEEIQTASK